MSCLKTDFYTFVWSSTWIISIISISSIPGYDRRITLVVLPQRIVRLGLLLDVLHLLSTFSIQRFWRFRLGCWVPLALKSIVIWGQCWSWFLMWLLFDWMPSCWCCHSRIADFASALASPLEEVKITLFIWQDFCVFDQKHYLI